MAQSIKRIEREFLLKQAMEEKIPLSLEAGGGEWDVLIDAMTREHLTLSHHIPLRMLTRGAVYEFHFSYREQNVAFKARLADLKDKYFACDMPEFLYKDLARRFVRRPAPSDIAISFAFKGDRYELAFPKSDSFEPVEKPRDLGDFESKDLRELIKDFDKRAQDIAGERAIIMYKGKTPETPEERLVWKTAKILYLPTALGGIPESDPFLTSRIVTKAMLRDYLVKEGSDEAFAAENALRFERGLRSEGYLSLILVPIVFQEYIIGCVKLANRQQGKPPFDLQALETYSQFAKILAWSLMDSGYFANAPRKSGEHKAEALDLSAGGMLFVSSDRGLSSSLAPGTELEVSIKTSKRTVTVPGVLKRRYASGGNTHYGLEFLSIEPEDFRFLFELLYGRPYTEADHEKLAKDPFKGDQ